MTQKNELKTIPISKITNPEAWAGRFLDYASMTNDAKALVLHSGFVEHEYIRMLLAKILDTKGVDGCDNQELSFLANRVTSVRNYLDNNNLSLELITKLFFENISLNDYEITELIENYDFSKSLSAVQNVEL